MFQFRLNIFLYVFFFKNLALYHVKIYKVPLSFFFVDSIEYRVEIKISRKWSRLLSRGRIKRGLLTIFMREWWWREGEIDSN